MLEIFFSKKALVSLLSLSLISLVPFLTNSSFEPFFSMNSFINSSGVFPAGLGNAAFASATAFSAAVTASFSALRASSFIAFFAWARISSSVFCPFTLIVVCFVLVSGKDILTEWVFVVSSVLRVLYSATFCSNCLTVLSAASIL